MRNDPNFFLYFYLLVDMILINAGWFIFMLFVDIRLGFALPALAFGG